MKLNNHLYYLQNSKFLKTWVVYCIDLILSISSSFAAIEIVNGLFATDLTKGLPLTLWIGTSFIITTLVFATGKVYKSVIRYSTIREVGKLCNICLWKSILLWLSMAAFSHYSYRTPQLAGLVVIDFLLTLFILSVVRVLMIAVYDKIRKDAKLQSGISRILVYGTSDKAASTLSRLRNSPHYHIVGFISSGEEIKGHCLAGLKVHYCSNSEDLVKISNTTDITGVLFPYLADARKEQDAIIKYCRENGIRTYIIPGVDEMTDKGSLGNYIRKIRIEDLLGREEIKLSMPKIIENFNNKVVMVTGAAGSIGSELCRQLATFGVARLILFDNAETPLHNIRLELEDKYPKLDFIPIIGDVRSLERLDFVFRQYRPQIVFHAAAYKHVPLMEENPCEAVMVNVSGSRHVADKCVEYDVDRMIMVSTDKAVNPTNIMGCTKRLAEIYVQSLGLAIEKGEIEGRTRFVTTRFGNVLGSNGSVIPRFRSQIERGGPVTVTHPEITRFFMTIPEACRLVMEAATFASGTQIFVFDMGESVKIATLAKKMITLAGLEVGRDIEIKYTGLRPGEKLYEEVLATKENTIPTDHDRIFVAKAREYPYENAKEIVNQLTILASQVEIPDMVILMKHTVPEFKSKNSEYEIYDNIKV